eukprot:TRINITY_DN14504_c0_g1_i1.p1 TRINITY_DN14504_c0_g1~~TRINITY_DN14504_c0_g1_i1.p1  ORF type:complete len:448 (+),score=85.04 TRINITY_DN14504_c0_g1_i1:40-1383(+)
MPVVRSSKFRHVWGKQAKPEECYDNFRVSRTAWDSHLIAASPTHFALLWEAGGGGSFAVLPFSKTGKWDQTNALVAGHKSPVLDLDFNPMNNGIVASASEDCTAKLWSVPEEALESTVHADGALQTLIGHKRKVGSVNFHPTANNILATTSTDYSVKIWDIEKGNCSLSIDAQHSDIIQSFDWNSNGSLSVTSSKDKGLRVLDPRQQKVAQEKKGAHAGAKGSMSCWIGDRIFSVGFGAGGSGREYCIWDSKNLENPLKKAHIDNASGLLMPFFDPDTKLLFLGGKGDGNIRYYEVVDEDPYIHYIEEFKSNTPSRGLCMLPKRAVNVSETEIVRMLKCTVNSVIPISFAVPRKSDLFADDLYVDCFSGEPSLEASEWLGGKDAEQKKQNMENGFVHKPKEVKIEKKEEKVLSEKELREEYEKQKNRISYLEAELIKRDNRIKELEK